MGMYAILLALVRLSQDQAVVLREGSLLAGKLRSRERSVPGGETVPATFQKAGSSDGHQRTDTPPFEGR